MKVLVTGGTNGMGKGVAKILAQSNKQTHEVIILGRSKEHGEAATREIKELTNNKKISLVLCDLTKLSDVRKAIKEIHNQHKFLDGVFINAGLGYAANQMVTEDGLDSHFQVNYLSQFMLTLNVLDLLEKSKSAGRVIFNVTEMGELFWDDMQMEKKWSYESGIYQAMAAKRMFYCHLHKLHRQKKGSKLAFFGFRIPKTVWTNQINIIPPLFRTVATIMKFFGTFISIEECGRIISPLFTENQDQSLEKSGKFITSKRNTFVEKKVDKDTFDHPMQEKLWKISLDLCKDRKTTKIAETLSGSSL